MQHTSDRFLLGAPGSRFCVSHSRLSSFCTTFFVETITEVLWINRGLFWKRDFVFFGSSGPCSVPVAMLIFFFFFFAPPQKTCAITELKKCLHTKAGAGESLKFDGSFQIFSPSLQTAAALCSLCVRFTVPNHTLSLQNAAQSSLQSGKSC